MRRRAGAALLARCVWSATSPSSAKSLRERLRRLGAGASLEIPPSKASTVARLLDGRRRTVFVNMIQAEVNHFDDVCQAVAVLRHAGLEPVPHIPASVLGDEVEATTVVRRLAAAGASQALCLGGNDPNPGPLSRDAPHVDRLLKNGHPGLDSSRLAELCLGDGLMDRVGFAGFPQGHPLLGNVTGDGLLQRKLRRFAEKCFVVSQWSFDTLGVEDWLEAQILSNGASCLVGVPGPASPRTLQRFAAICDVGPSKNLDLVLKEGQDHGTDGAVDTVEPVATVEMIASLLERNGRGSIGLHLYPFGGIDSTLQLIDNLEEGTWPS